jgi:hypothetical protein
MKELPSIAGLDHASPGSTALICLYSRTAFDRTTHVYWCIETIERGSHFVGEKIPCKNEDFNDALKLVTKDLEEWIGKLIKTSTEINEFSLKKLKMFIDVVKINELLWLENSIDISIHFANATQSKS